MSSNRYKWGVLAMLSCAFFFHQADRALFGLLTLPIQEDLGLSDIQIGWVNTALSWTLAAMTMVAGFAGDRLSRKWLITGSLMFWSLATMAMGFAGEWRVLGVTIPAFFVVMFLRAIATGGGESFYGPSAMALLAAHHRETRSLAFSVHQAALYIGLMTSGVLVALALGIFRGWRQVFIFFGLTGFLLGVFFVFALKDSSDDARPSTVDYRLPSALKAFFCNPSALCATSGFVAIVFVNNAYLFWAPKFMAMKFGVSVGEAGAQTMLYHHLFAFVAILLGGMITDRFVKRMPRFRLGFQIVALLCGAPCLMLVGLSSSMAVMIAMTAGYGVFRGFFEVNTHASVFDVVAPEYRSTVVGLMVMTAFIFGGLSGVVMGILSQRYGGRGFEIGFIIMGVSYIMAALVMMISYRFTFFRDRLPRAFCA